MSEPVNESLTDEQAAGDDESSSEHHEERLESKGLRDLQHVERHLSMAALRMSRAMTRGIDEYRNQQERSARAEEDGAVFEMPYNIARGLATATQEASQVPLDLVKAIDTPTNRKLVRLGTRLMFFPLSR